MEQSEILLWSLILMRVSGFIFVNPIFGRRGIPNIVKTGLVLGLSFFLISYNQQETVEAANLLEYIVLLLKEFTLGYIVGFIVSLFQYVIVFAGGIIDFQMGMSMSTVFDAQSNSSIALSATMLNFMFILVFFTIDGHVALIQILINMREAVPYGSLTLNPEIISIMLQLFAKCTLLGVQLAFPIIALEFIGEAGVGILMKTIPQINVFAVNIQTKILIGLISFVFLIGPMGSFVNNLILSMVEQIQSVIGLM